MIKLPDRFQFFSSLPHDQQSSISLLLARRKISIANWASRDAADGAARGCDQARMFWSLLREPLQEEVLELCKGQLLMREETAQVSFQVGCWQGRAGQGRATIYHEI